MWPLIYAAVLFTLAVSVFLYQPRRDFQPHRRTCEHSHSKPHLSFCCLSRLFRVKKCLTHCCTVTGNTYVNAQKNTSSSLLQLCESVLEAMLYLRHLLHRLLFAIMLHWRRWCWSVAYHLMSDDWWGKYKADIKISPDTEILHRFNRL